MKPGPHPKPLHDRIDKVSKPGCWLWTGKIDVYGYGKLSVDGKEEIASRHSWRLHCGNIPDGLCVLHRCDTPACVNPDHLFLGTRNDNHADMLAKGRARGAAKYHRYNAILTEADVASIRTDPRNGPTIAAQYGVNKTTIYDIKSGKTWRSPQ